ncbi:MAG: S-layer homology domain-containing protein, partial [Oscillospiraceae bacterium]|nr:S-layer homology domain-containing protein [Oscillospiraceae bacterium]
MKNLRKILSLVLVVVMAMSLVTFASAVNYKELPDWDDADPAYKEAIDVVTALGIFQGSDGQLLPKGTFSRAEAAKIITYLKAGA